MAARWDKTIQRARRAASNPWRRLLTRFVHRADPRPPIFANSFPKSGTYLLSRCLDLLPGVAAHHRGVYVADNGRHRFSRRRDGLRRMSGGTYVSAHLPYSAERRHFLEDHGFSHLLILRDPRDVAVSFAKFEYRYPWLPRHAYFAGLADDDARLLAAIAGDESVGYGGLIRHLLGYVEWLGQPGCLLVRFEDLVGESGGGSREGQLEAVASIARQVAVDLSPEACAEVARQVFDSGSQTFRRGVIGDWRRHFKPAHLEALERVAGDVLATLGYDAA